MIFSILVILFIGIIAFFHYVQGFFSATISAMITILAAALAVGYDETVVNLMLKGKMAEQAHAIVLCMIFAVVYVVLRIVFDAAIPGNVRTPSTVDKVGAGLMGIVAGIFCTGIFSIAVQMLPFDPTISFMGYSRYKTSEKKSAYVQTKGQSKDSFIYEEMAGNSFTPENLTPLWVPTDDLVLNTIYHLSDGGSLAGERPLASVHPDYLQELFGERVGIQIGGKHTTLNLNGEVGAEVNGLFTAASFPCFDGQMKEMRPSDYQPLYKLTGQKVTDPKAPPLPDQGEVKPNADQRILVVRVKVKAIDADEADRMFRFSTGSVHLVGKARDGKSKDFYPIGTLQGGSAVLLDKPDDFLFTKEDGEFDAVFVVDASLFTGTKTAFKLNPGTSITIKRFASVDLSGMDVSQKVTSDPNVDVERAEVLMDRLKLSLPAPAAEAPAVSVGTPNAAAPSGVSNPSPGGGSVVEPAAPVMIPHIAGRDIAQDISGTVGNTFKASISISTSSVGEDVKNAPVAGGTVSLRGGKIEVASIDPSATLTALGSADNAANQLFSPPNRTVVQIAIHPYSPGWEWVRQIGTVNLIDANGNPYPPNGVYQAVRSGGTTGLYLRYNASSQSLAVSSSDGVPDGDLYFIFLIPHGTDVKSFSMGGKNQDLSSIVSVQ